MVVRKIIIENFRNLDSVYIEPSDFINFFVGDNAHGKTNLIEAIYFLAFGKSFRTNNFINLLNNKKKCIIKFTIFYNDVLHNLKVEIDKNKVIEINGKKSTIKDVSNFFKVIIYYPSEINFLLKYPSLRRNLIDKSIFLLDTDYIDLHLNYLKCLKNRNICLKKNIDDYIWKEKIIELSYEIVKRRILYIEEINHNFFQYDSFIEGENYHIEYKKLDIINYINNLKNDFKKVENKEKKVGYTLLGQHTDSISFYINKMNLDIFGSEGQKKFFLLFYKYIQLIHFNKNKKYKPLLIIDDATSEIDNKREMFLINNLLSNCDQSFVTSLKKPSFYKEGDKIFFVNNGKIFDIKESS